MGVAYPMGAIVVPFSPDAPQPVPSKRTALGCTLVAEGLPRESRGGLAGHEFPTHHR